MVHMNKIIAGMYSLLIALSIAPEFNPILWSQISSWVCRSASCVGETSSGRSVFQSRSFEARLGHTAQRTPVAHHSSLVVAALP